ncbi:hypothetical protein TPHA_0H01450 [Tetrapisispora phaffii CBS 4417]|uniref:Protein phosphatase n=1 Tax=Tetrapisispora phaffii (strain ATCC 24235 / CBS 4417 / NBRC 1672 / NRRL Y-8282 / UCD 70-5) TaxID=1071381 RepID=G8BX47_TETPH|nr:hypothetical protein TPHA_0H01450 [Tetrapisispora phaffii CBS 4417]CCE64351.1 hypothetical protein TPHA_0H01450 [Tetrapisispora phaffii CBS 4417]
MYSQLLASILVLIFAVWILIPISSVSLIAHVQYLKGNFYNLSKRCFTSTGTFNDQSGNYSSYNYYTTSSQPQDTGLSYKLAVAYQPKDRDDPIYKNLKSSLDSPTGEDNYFVRKNANNDVYVGVADGVGGWASYGYDSSAISRELCKAMSDYSTIKNQKNSLPFYEINPKTLIDISYNKIKDEKIVNVGGTTAIVGHFPPSGKLQLANLGDSWCGVFRDYKLVFKTNFQTVGFNAPYQLAIIPKELLSGKENSYIQNKPSDADEYTFQLEKDDIILLATDGVTDNIATGDMENFFRDNEASTEEELQTITKKFVKEVVAISIDPDFPSVFAQEISKLTGKDYRGGKEDDITVVVVKAE